MSYWANSLKKSLFNGYLTPVTLTFDNFFLTTKLCLPFYHSIHSCQSSYKSVNNFLSYRGNSLKIVIFNRYLTPVTFTCNLQLWPIFLTIELIFPFIIIHYPAKGHQNRPITFWVIVVTRLVWQTDRQTDKPTQAKTIPLIILWWRY